METRKSLKTEKEIHFEMVVSWLIDWVCLKCHANDKSIDWLTDRLIDWLLYSTRARGDMGFALVSYKLQ